MTPEPIPSGSPDARPAWLSIGPASRLLGVDQPDFDTLIELVRQHLQKGHKSSARAVDEQILHIRREDPQKPPRLRHHAVHHRVVGVFVEDELHPFVLMDYAASIAA